MTSCCQSCGVDDRTRVVRMVNGSDLTLRPPCRRKHDPIIAETPIADAADRREQEDLALS